VQKKDCFSKRKGAHIVQNTHFKIALHALKGGVLRGVTSCESLLKNSEGLVARLMKRIAVVRFSGDAGEGRKSSKKVSHIDCVWLLFPC